MQITNTIKHDNIIKNMIYEHVKKRSYLFLQINSSDINESVH